MNTMLTTLGTQAEFHQTWQALMRQLETLLSIAHMRNPNRTQTLEAVSIAKQLLGIVGDQLDKAVQELTPRPPAGIVRGQKGHHEHQPETQGNPDPF